MELKEEIWRIYDKSRKRYGSSRIHQQLLREDYHIGKKRVERLMQELNIQVIAKKRYKATNTSWVADTTHIWTLEGFLYLATIMDLYSC